VKELCYRLFSICERNGWAQEALGYNMLISSWPEIARLAAEMPSSAREGELDFG
jgi:putative DNA methylase